jgi:endonuclease G
MKLALITAAFAVAFGFTPFAYAACPAQFQNGVEPRAIHVSYAERTHDICYEAFAVWTSGQTRTPLWSAEHLTAENIAAARALPRHDDFHPEADLPRQDRAELADYVHSGFDRGHLTPSGDMPSAEAQAQSFSLANIVPQDSALNRGLWEEIESATRDLASRDGELYVVTGPIFANAPEALHQRVLVPAALFKAIYDPRRNAAVAVIAVNSHPAQYRTVSIAELRDLTGIDPFPALAEDIKRQTAELVIPSRPHYGDQIGERPPARPSRRRERDLTEVADRGPRIPIPN